MSEFSDFVSNVRKSSPWFDEFLESVDVVLCTVVFLVTVSPNKQQFLGWLAK